MTRDLRNPDRPMDPEAHARELVEQGYSVFGKLWSDAEVAELRQVVVDELERRRPDALWAEVAEDSSYARTPAGLAHYHLLSEHPELAPRLFKAEVLDALRLALGEGMRLEMGASMVSDASRPYVGWHCHLDGGGDGRFRRWGWPTVPTLRRLQALLYLDDLDDETGPLVVHPRRATDPTDPPGDPAASEWEGEVVIRAPRGTLVVISEATWHAARPMQREGLRIFLVTYFRRRGVPFSDFADPNLPEVAPYSDLVAPLVTPGPDDAPDPALDLVVPAFPEQRAAALRAEVERAVPGWRLGPVHRESHEVRFDLDSPAGKIRLVACEEKPRMPSFHSREGVAYTYWGELADPEPLTAVVDVVHAFARELLTDSS